MIYPRRRLLIWVAAIVLPCTAVAGLPAAGAAAVATAVLLILALAADGLLAVCRPVGLRIEADPVVRVARGQRGHIRIRITPRRGGIPRLRIQLPLPWPLHSESLDLCTPAPKDTGTGVRWSFLAPRTGRYRAEDCYLDTSSPLGFWSRRRTVRIGVEIRVYPNLLREQGNLRALLLAGKAGQQPHRPIGKGREFDHLREYMAGDGYEDIHWKATARHGHPVTKTYRIERVQEVYVAIDTSRLSARTAEASPAVAGKKESIPETVLERFVTAALIMGLAAERQGDRFGLITFSDRVDTFLRSHSGKGHTRRCRDALYALQARPVTADIDELIVHVATQLRRRALLVLLTSLDDPVLAETLLDRIELIRRRHVVMVAMLRPPGVRPLFSSHRPQDTDDIYRHLGGHLVWDGLREVGTALRRRGVAFSLAHSRTLCRDLISQYVEVKQRQIL